jgi:hypothetical protein
MLRSRVTFNQSDWDEHLATAELAVNNAVQASTGFTPFYLNYGKEVSLPIDQAVTGQQHPSDNPEASSRIRRLHSDLARAKANIEQAQLRQAKYVDRHRRDVTFKVGDKVLLSTEHIKFVGSETRTPKFASKFVGPFEITRVAHANAYELKLPPTWQIHPVFNISRLRVYKDGRAAFPSRPLTHSRPPPEAVLEDGAEVFEVQSILAKRGTGRRVDYLVEWKGYPLHEATWERAATLTNARKAVQAYEARVLEDQDRS